MYNTQPSFMLGFHGCDKSLVEDVISGRDMLRASENDYDWLGNGIYFWENDPVRALEYARLLQENPTRSRAKISEPAVIGAVLDPGNCLNLMESSSLRLLRDTYDSLNELLSASGVAMRVNSAPSGSSQDLLLRRLDCSVIEYLHRKNTGRDFDTVRGLFFEGEDLYPNAGFKTKNHIQVCVRNPNCIKGFFLPREPDAQYSVP